MQGGTGLILGWGTRDPHALHEAKYKMKIQHLWLKTTNTDYLSFFLCVGVCIRSSGAAYLAGSGSQSLQAHGQDVAGATV